MRHVVRRDRRAVLKRDRRTRLPGARGAWSTIAAGFMMSGPLLSFAPRLPGSSMVLNATQLEPKSLDLLAGTRPRRALERGSAVRNPFVPAMASLC
jgi:hypothetical protein